MPLSGILQHADLYHDLRHWLRIDPSCCAQLPYEDETVFHFRNFVTEIEVLNKSTTKERFGELTPGDTAQHLFGPPPPLSHSISSHMSSTSTSKHQNNHSASSNRIAIISRYPSTATPYAQALHDQGWKVQVIQNQSGIQDFCFAMSTQATVVGVAHSTFVQLPGLLGNASTVRWYYLTQTMGKQRQSSTKFCYETKDRNHLTSSAVGLVEQKRTFFPLDPSVLNSPQQEFRQELVCPSGFITGQSLKQQSDALLVSTPDS